jgi:hypothetical protein
MGEPIAADLLSGFRELLSELRGVGAALVEVVERTARLETKVDRLVADQAQTAGMQARIADLEGWVKSELAQRSARGAVRGVWIGSVATVVGGGIGAAVAHFWK